MRIRTIGACVIALAVGGALAGCPAFPGDLCRDGFCDSTVDGGGSSSGSSDAKDDRPTIDAPPGCDLTKDPKDSPACIDDAVGIFVSPTGSDGATGAKGAPVKTIGKALSIAGPKRVYVCEGSYEGFELKTGTTIAGGFACADWKYTGTKPKVEGTDGAKPTVDVAASGALLLDLEINGPAKGVPNSVAVRAVDSTATLRRVKLSAGEGADGADGVRTDFTYPTQTQLDGNNADMGNGGLEKSFTCPGSAITKGGKGGDNGFGGADGLPALGDGKGGDNSNCASGGTGSNGRGGTTPSPVDGAKVLGTIVATAWVAQVGGNGGNGGPGQGGGGGYGSGGGGGGGGGAGGCGGAGGPGGKGGGASIALLSINSTLTLETSSLNSSKAGNGGKGAAGQAGQTIFGIRGVGAGLGCNGGSGGKGGDGAAGGGGAGGLSAALLYTKTKPTLKDTTTSAGTAGSAGVGGVPSTNDGVAGDSKTELEIK